MAWGRCFWEVLRDWEDFSSAIFQLTIKFTLREIAITRLHRSVKVRRHFLRETVFSSTLKIYFCLFLSSLATLICRLFSSPLLIKTSINHFKKSKNKKQRGTPENYRCFPDTLILSLAIVGRKSYSSMSHKFLKLQSCLKRNVCYSLMRYFSFFEAGRNEWMKAGKMWSHWFLLAASSDKNEEMFCNFPSSRMKFSSKRNKFYFIHQIFL